MGVSGLLYIRPSSEAGRYTVWVNLWWYEQLASIISTCSLSPARFDLTLQIVHIEKPWQRHTMEKTATSTLAQRTRYTYSFSVKYVQDWQRGGETSKQVQGVSPVMWSISLTQARRHAADLTLSQSHNLSHPNCLRHVYVTSRLNLYSSPICRKRAFHMEPRGEQEHLHRGLSITSR